MTPRAEATLIVLAALVAGAGTAVVSMTAYEGLSNDALVAAATILAAYGGLFVAVRRWAPAATGLLLPTVALLTSIGFIEIYRIDPHLGRLQRLWLLLAAAIAGFVLWVLRRRGVEILRRFRYLFLLAAMGLLLMPLLPARLPIGGATVNGSRLWVRLDLGERSLSFQPGEAAKLLLVVFFASYLAERAGALGAVTGRLGSVRLPAPRQLMPMLVVFGVSFMVLVYQRDLGASLLLFALFVAMLYVATGRRSYLAAGGAMAAGGALSAVQTFGHVQTRVEAWLRPFDDFTGVGYQTAQGLFALGEAGITGTGLGAGAPYLIPAAATDYLFVAVVEETGLAGGLAVLMAYALIMAVGFGIALRARDRFRSLLAAGLTLVLAVQTFIILAGVLRLLPLTGITLPFMSYGGSSLLANLTLIAVLARISHEERV